MTLPLAFATTGFVFERLSCANRQTSRLLNRPPAFQALTDQPFKAAKVTTGLRHSRRISVRQRQALIVARVLALLEACRPAAILGRIRPVVVVALQGVIWRRRWPHVGVEPLERTAPRVADGDASRAVDLVGFRRSLIAASLDACPRMVFLGAAHAVGDSVLSCPDGSIASATGRQAICQVAHIDLFPRAASALAPKIARIQVSSRGFGFNDPIPELASRLWRHSAIISRELKGV